MCLFWILVYYMNGSPANVIIIYECVWFQVFLVVNATFNNIFSYIVAIRFIGGGNRNTRRKPPACRKQQTVLHNVANLALSEIRTHNFHSLHIIHTQIHININNTTNFSDLKMYIWVHANFKDYFYFESLKKLNSKISIS